jgi:hypothetical protein
MVPKRYSKCEECDFIDYSNVFNQKWNNFEECIYCDSLICISCYTQTHSNICRNCNQDAYENFCFEDTIVNCSSCMEQTADYYIKTCNTCKHITCENCNIDDFCIICEQLKQELLKTFSKISINN